MDKLTAFHLRNAEYKDFLALIANETDEYNKLVSDKPETPFHRRLKVRVQFACIEAFLSLLKTAALAFDELNTPSVFSQDDKLALEDLRKGPDGNIVGNRSKLKDSLPFALDAFARALGGRYLLDKQEPHWARFFEAVKIRDRVMHPKCHADWKISDEEAKLIDDAWAWFGGNVVNLVNKAEEANNRQITAIPHTGARKHPTSTLNVAGLRGSK